MQNKPISIDMPQIHSPKYKNNLKDIEQSVKQLNNYTNNLQGKVANMLKGQETQFVNSYKNHMNNIQKALQNYQNKIKEYQKKIQYYENQGPLATLLKRIQFLQEQERKMLSTVQKKDQIIFEMRTQRGLFQSQIRSLKIHIKEMMHLKVNNHVNNHRSSHLEKSQERTFATQINVVDRSVMRSIQSHLKNHQTTLDYSADNHCEQQSKSQKDKQMKRMSRQLSTLKKKHRQMSSVTSKIIQRTGQINQFFLKTIEQLKRKILIRKQLKQCSFQDFKQEDKLQLMIRILSNEDILKHLYEKIFHNSSYRQQDQTNINQLQKIDLKKNQISQTHNKLPAIYSQRRT